MVASAAGLRKVRFRDPKVFIDRLREAFPDVVVQAVNPRFTAGFLHIRLVLEQAWEAWRRGLTYAEKPEMDLIVRFACDTQIKSALRTVGLPVGFQQAVALYVGDRAEIPRFEVEVRRIGSMADDLVHLDPGKRRFLMRHHNITAQQILSSPVRRGALAYLLAEKAAALVTEQG